VNLLLLDRAEVDASGAATLEDARAAHVIDVLGATPGRDVRIGLLDGPLGAGRVTGISDRRVTVQCTFDAAVPDRPRVDLLLALPRPKVMRRLWAQVAALGVGRIMLTNAERVERPYFDTHVLDPSHYRPLLIEGLQQARDTRVPEVSIHRRFKVLIEDELPRNDDRLRVVADPAGTASMAAGVQARPPERVLLAIGPEGGWNDFERRLLQQHGFELAGMGPRTLRSDTACVALLALVHAALAANG
jgi:RsmE family RNA methyltransferase